MGSGDSDFDPAVILGLELPMLLLGVQQWRDVI